MRRVTYKSVLDRIAGYFGEARGLSAEEAVLCNAKVNLFARLGWRGFWWPELLSVEKRALRPPYNVLGLTTYNLGAEVYDAASGEYFQSLQDGNVGSAPTVQDSGGTWVVNGPLWAACGSSYSGDDYALGTVYAPGDIVRYPQDGLYYQCLIAHTAGGLGQGFSTTTFGRLKVFVRSLDFEDVSTVLAGTANVVGDVKTIYVNDPDVYPRERHRTLPFVVRGDFVLIGGGFCPNWTPGVFWLEHRLRVPSWSGATRTDTATYGSGVTVYDTATGDYWTSSASIAAGESPTTTPAKWVRVEFPYILAEFVAQSAYASLTNKEQEEPENFSVEDAAGYPLLAQELDILERQQGQVRQLRVMGRR